MLTRIKNTFSTFFRLFKIKNRQKVLWSDLKKYFVNSDLHYGIFESERYIEAKYLVSISNLLISPEIGEILLRAKSAKLFLKTDYTFK